MCESIRLDTFDHNTFNLMENRNPCYNDVEITLYLMEDYWGPDSDHMVWSVTIDKASKRGE